MIVKREQNAGGKVSCKADSVHDINLYEKVTKTFVSRLLKYCCRIVLSDSRTSYAYCFFIQNQFKLEIHCIKNLFIAI